MESSDRDRRSLPGADDNSVMPLSRLVQREARRQLTEDQFAPDPALTAQGWLRRFMADGRRAAEAMALYESLGYEVRAEPVSTREMGDDCDDCQLLARLEFKTVYTRKRNA